MAWKPFRSKAVWAALAALATAIGAYLAGEIGSERLIEVTFAAFMVIFVRAGVAKNGKGK